MKNGNTREFIESIDHQDARVEYRGRHYFVNGCCNERDENGKECWARLEMYEMDADNRNATGVVCSIVGTTTSEVIERFLAIPLIDGKTFWELENELEWV